MSARVIKPAEDVEPPTLTVVEACPCGATYRSGRTKDSAVWEAWATFHATHGMSWERGEIGDDLR